MRSRSFEGFVHEEKKRLAVIEGRADLFETKRFHIEPLPSSEEREPQGSVLVLTRDPGSANAVVPVMEYLHRHPGIDLHALADGRAQEVLQQRLPSTDMGLESFLGTDQAIRRPDVMLSDASSEQGIETYAAATFDDVPMVLVEDYYTSSYGYLRALQERGLRLPEKICVIDEVAKRMLVKHFPELGSRVEVTGQPAFDRFAHEDTAELGQRTRTKLGLGPDDRLVAFMSTGVDKVELPAMAESMKDISGSFVLGFRKHPRDNTTYEEYESIFGQAGIKTINVQDFTTDEVSAAADVIMTSWSTEGIHGVYRRKPTIHLIDEKYLSPPKELGLPLPPDELGASVGVNDIDQLPEVVSELLDAHSSRLAGLKKNMEQFYPVDGKNTERVAVLVQSFFPGAHRPPAKTVGP